MGVEIEMEHVGNTCRAQAGQNCSCAPAHSFIRLPTFDYFNRLMMVGAKSATEHRRDVGKVAVCTSHHAFTMRKEQADQHSHIL